MKSNPLATWHQKVVGTLVFFAHVVLTARSSEPPGIEPTVNQDQIAERNRLLGLCRNLRARHRSLPGPLRPDRRTATWVGSIPQLGGRLMRHLPSSVSDLKRKAVGLVLLLMLGPALLMTAAQVIGDVVAPLIPWVIAAIVLAGLYSLVIGRYRR